MFCTDSSCAKAISLRCGIFNIDKPAGISSRKVVDRVAKIVKPAKAGHAGTLDPPATGVLVLLLGRTTRLLRFLDDEPKHYTGTFRLGITTLTDDAAGARIAPTLATFGQPPVT